MPTRHIVRLVEPKSSQRGSIPRFLLIGAGLFAQKTYIPYIKALEKDDRARLMAIVEVHGMEDTVRGITRYAFPDTHLFFVPPFTSSMPDVVDVSLSQIASHLKIDCVIISTEPLAHTAYGLWALDQGLNVIMDKPISTRKGVCTDENAALGISEDYKDLLVAYEKVQKRKRTCYLIQSHRRYHPGFQFLLQNIRQLQNKTSCPITSLNSSHCDGMWRMPHEIVDQDYHTFKNGYGKLSHSGYHLLDVCSQFMRWSWGVGSNSTKAPNKLEVISSFITPGGFYTALNRADYERIFGAEYVKQQGHSDDDLWRLMEDMGEIDCGIMMTAFRDGQPICLVQLNLLHTGFSRRSSVQTGTDLYRGVGRVKHESHDIKCGPFETIVVESRKSLDKGVPGLSPNCSLGGENHFDVNIFQNNCLLNNSNTAVQSYTMDDILKLYPAMSGDTSEKVKRGILEEALDFMDGRVHADDLVSNLPDHALPAYIMSAAYLSHVRKRMGQNPAVTIELDNDCKDLVLV
ncbi:hypothetical protein BDV59DRAFT_208165 [Aspergillus ambiguus]|uniref:uncharacterized protein n=1 Tax=Aspergillus ambiguus TaxID=176160 RepID=UPI003CCDA9B3